MVKKILRGLVFLAGVHVAIASAVPAAYAEPYKITERPRGFKSWGCAGKALAELAVPGLGYLINGEYDKALVFGGLRWGARNISDEAEKDPNYQGSFNDKYEKIDKADSSSDKEEEHFYYNKSTFDNGTYGTIGFNLGLLSTYDFYAHSCEYNNDTYARLSDPLNVPHYYDKWYFWVTVGALLAYDHYSDSQYTYHLGDGLTESYMRQHSFGEYYMVGIGEETFFRGVIQSFFNELYEGWDYSKKASWHMGVASASVLFGLAHPGQGLQASPIAAFAIGILFGYVYQPAPDEFDIITASALHSWWGLISIYATYNSAKFVEKDSPIKDKKYTLLEIQRRF